MTLILNLLLMLILNLLLMLILNLLLMLILNLLLMFSIDLWQARVAMDGGWGEGGECVCVCVEGKRGCSI